jgi:hypothetical protein
MVISDVTGLQIGDAVSLKDMNGREVFKATSRIPNGTCCALEHPQAGCYFLQVTRASG